MMKSRLLSALMLGTALTVLGGPMARAQTAPQAPAAAPATPKRNIVIFVADGLRYGIVNKDTAPTLAHIQHDGVDFTNSHSVYPTVTTVNASVIATGHGVGDTGEYGNVMYLGMPALSAAFASAGGDMEDDATLQQTNDRFGPNYLNETSLLKTARTQGYLTAAIGKEGPVAIQDIEAVRGKASTLIIDDMTGWDKLNPPDTIPLAPDIKAAIKAAGLETQARDRGLNQSPGAYNLPGVQVANIYQQQWFVDVTTKVVLPKFAQSGQPFALVYWSRDPDGTQHNNGDSLNTLNPGINGPTSLAAVRNASDNLQALIDTLKKLGVYDNTDIFVTADHGFSTISRTSKTSYAATLDYPDDTVKGFLPQGFVAIDLAHALKLPLLDAYGSPIDYTHHFHTGGVAMLGSDPKNPDIIFIAGGGSDMMYLDPKKAKDLAPKIVAVLAKEDYTGGLFNDESLGAIPGALAMADVRLSGTAKTPKPGIYISFADHTTPACMKKWKNAELCSALVVDGNLQQGQGNHGALTRANTHNFMAAIGPDFKAGFKDPSPVSNADIAPTLIRATGLTPPEAIGQLKGRVAGEALQGGPASVSSQPQLTRSTPAANGFVTVLEGQSADGETYFDAAGQPGRVVGLKSK